MRGDVNLLKRVERESRRADRVQRKLRRKLKKETEPEPVYLQ